MEHTANRHWNTSEYEQRHGRKPRGAKIWAFIPTDAIWPGEIPYDGIAWIWGSYSDAKRQVSREYPEVAAWTVLP